MTPPTAQVQYARELLNVDSGEAMAALADAFHVLRGAPLRPWDPDRLHAWATSEPSATATARDAARFVLAVWNRETIPYLDAKSGKTLGPFDVVEAMARWDDRNRAAFLAWAQCPWWP